ncbi:Heparan sulfate glucosamine 3-O-sulfotransferase 5 [Orchesella cincta]|uniref:Heparan sulfate glucosamine 3-O-sulfotransferase 5 n=1 Tax=Orchesella cincta TaxID=48709 RepID=A0A1D2MJF3_ORCCI|nr:Heparan sulfate glucosamine 3-O-sulfotransferase 5 [Orchesella cincta]
MYLQWVFGKYVPRLRLLTPQTVLKCLLIITVLYKLQNKPESEEPQVVRRKTLPSVLIIGARKCGTRALIDMLNLHPQVCNQYT